MYAIYIYGNLVTWIPSIYPLYVSINIAAPAGSVMGTVKFTSSVAAKKNPPHPTTSHDIPRRLALKLLPRIAVATYRESHGFGRRSDEAWNRSWGSRICELRGWEAAWWSNDFLCRPCARNTLKPHPLCLHISESLRSEIHKCPHPKDPITQRKVISNNHNISWITNHDWLQYMLCHIIIWYICYYFPNHNN